MFFFGLLFWFFVFCLFFLLIFVLFVFVFVCLFCFFILKKNNTGLIILKCIRNSKSQTRNITSNPHFHKQRLPSNLHETIVVNRLSHYQLDLIPIIFFKSSLGNQSTVSQVHQANARIPAHVQPSPGLPQPLQSETTTNHPQLTAGTLLYHTDLMS